MVRVLQVLANEAVVVDFAIGGEDNGLVGIGKRLGTGFWRRGEQGEGAMDPNTWPYRRRQC
jgi:hypothetical protein